MGQTGFSHILPAVVAALMSVAALATQARADSLRFSLGYNYSLSETETETVAGESSESRSDSFGQQYRLDFDRRLYPNLSLRGGGLFEQNDSESEVAGATSDSSVTRTSPYINLLLSTPLYNAGLGFSRVEDKSESNGVEQTPLIRDNYNAAFGWRPVDLPTLSLQYTRNEFYDRDRLQQDNINQRFIFGSTYKPTEQVGLSYQGAYGVNEDKLGGVRSQDFNHSARIDYTDQFWDDRVSLLGSYTYGQRSTKIVAFGEGEVETPFGAQAGLFGLDVSPGKNEWLDDVETSELEETPVFIDGPDSNIPTPSNPIPVNPLPSGADLVATDDKERNLGLQLQIDPSTGEFPTVNAFRVYVRNPTGGLFTADEMAFVTGTLRWDVYISDDSIPTKENQVTQNWELFASDLMATYDSSGTFSSTSPGFFEISFPDVKTEFIKVVVEPLPPTTIPSSILVTELEALRIVPAADVEGSSSSSSHQVNLSVRTRLLDSPSLYHSFSLFYTNVQPAAVSRTFVSNSLGLLHRIHPKVSLSAQVAREDTDEPRGKTVIHRWGASLLATPIPALRQNLAYSGQIADEVGLRSLRNALFLNNRATLYRGIDVVLNGGVSAASQSTGEDSMSYLVNFGATVTPHRSMTWDFSLGANRSTRRGGGQPETTSTSNRWRASLSYNPAAALGLFLAMEQVKQQEQTRTLQNYSVNWSPFSGGTLQFNLGYSESLRQETDTIDRSLSPTVTWEIRRGTFLAASYSWSESESPQQQTTSRVFGASLRATF